MTWLIIILIWILVLGVLYTLIYALLSANHRGEPDDTGALGLGAMDEARRADINQKELP